LLIDATAMDRNLQRMADFFRDRTCQLRPHFKNHKCTQIAKRQLAAGCAVGMTCAKLTEAEILAEAGIHDVLIANQIVGTRKLQRLAQLAKKIKLRLAIDDPAHIADLSKAATEASATIGFLIEVDIGMGRCGVPPGQPALDLAKQIVDAPGLRFDGLQAYEGHLVNVIDPQDRRNQTRESMQRAIDTRRLIENTSIPVAVISGGSSSTYATTGIMDGVDELQCGTYATMDWVYHRLVPEFEMAMSVLTRVISRPKPDVAVLDVGVKGVGHEFGPPQVKDRPDLEIPFFLSEEHCIVRGKIDWSIGKTIQLIPSHACTTSNLYREFHVHDNGKIIDRWPIEASGQPA
jgi:D-serine deaminase-like pyridoxal phosphate-dependent protein